MQKQNKTFWILLIVVLISSAAIYIFRTSRESDRFTHLTAVGKGYLEKGDATNAIAAYSQVVKFAPESPDARLNLANAYLLANDNPKVIEQCQQALGLDHNSAAAYYLMGCAYLRH